MVLPVCELCVHYRPGSADWGTCKQFEYEHKKHTGPPRELSVPRMGSCPSWEGEPKTSLRLQDYVLFVQAPAPPKET